MDAGDIVNHILHSFAHSILKLTMRGVKLTDAEKHLIRRVHQYFAQEKKKKNDPLNRDVRERTAQCLNFHPTTIKNVIYANEEQPASVRHSAPSSLFCRRKIR
jgi:hypothetical protein